jgi:hypothetical protein
MVTFSCCFFCISICKAAHLFPVLPGASFGKLRLGALVDRALDLLLALIEVLALSGTSPSMRSS